VDVNEYSKSFDSSFITGAKTCVQGVIAWVDGNPTVYKFYIEVSTDAQQWGTPVFTGQSSGNTTDYESYPCNEKQAKFVRVTVKDSSLGSPTGNSQAQISEIRVFSNA
jgi:hypothetical protein